MELLDFGRYPLWINLVVTGMASIAVWFAGTRLAREADAIAKRTGAGDAFVGLILLGGIVSLPELATSITASWLGNPAFAVSTLVGGISAIMFALAVVDAVTSDEPVSSDVRHPIVLFQGVLTVLFLVVAAAGMAVGDVAVVLGVGVWSTALLVLYLLFVLLVKRYQRREPWVVGEELRASIRRAPDAGPEEGPDPDERRPLSRIVLATVVSAIVTLAAGIALAGAGDAIVDQTGLGAGFVGMLIGGIATSLPEATTFYTAVRLRQYELAFGDAFGTNLFSTMAIFFADLAYDGGPILVAAGRFGLLATLLGIAVTATYLAGCIERPNRRVLGMGVDSLVVIVAYVGGLILLYRIR